MSNLNLVSIMREDVEFEKRLARKVKEIKADKENLSNIADEYGGKYRQEILEGTQLRAKLLNEGAARGLEEEEAISQYGKFVPCVQTPILNLLYFLLRESSNDPHYGEKHYKNRDKLNEQFGSLKEAELKSEFIKDPPAMIEYLYGNTTLEKFNLIKKLKALAQSPNEAEAFQAYRKALEMCKQEGLEFDKIPLYVDKRS